ncbi:DNA-binding MurR/RpiR family transcriptional regulator [Bacillus pakistanensis]|uniref:DNA-binding MurR/RpiR family transcriptional regulator n=1 Tax=Rossellomorea pakistanensis TaxID=992288 RepID=A0ABS2NHF7_9BACI|nr:MurR/RpiR family transcriptional regulator [Bacillus pakistanensis]MBM7587264.1 DNA-binding MurR/RpiR family transcriptional regulator [Bacillus pakistanensis]
MNHFIFDIPADQYQSLSESERYLLEYIVKNIERIPNLSIVKLSEEANVSTATIVRLMKKIGHDGFTSFKYNIKDHMNSEENVEVIDEIDSKIQKAIKKNELEVINTIQMLNKGNIEDTIQKINDAEKIYIFARGFSEMIASEMNVKLQLLGKNSEMHNDPNIIRVISRRLKEKELAIFVSLNGETKELVEACKNLKIQNISTITLTAGVDSSLAKLSEITLLGYKGSHSFFPDYEVRSRLPLQVISRIILDAYVIRMV